MSQKELELDFDQLRSLTGEDSEFMIEILEIIEEQSPDVLVDMKEQLAKQEYSVLSATAHKYKSSINILGNYHLNRIVKDIENYAKESEKWEDLQNLIGEFEELCDKLLFSIKKELDDLRA